MKNKKNLGLWLSLLIILGIAILPTTAMAKAGLAVVLLGAFLFWKRSILFYIQGNRHLVKKDQSEWHKAWPLYQKALHSGLVPAYRITVASMYIQRSDANEGKAIIEAYLAEKKKNEDLALTNIAKTMLSMVYWMDGDMQKATSLVKEVYDSGYRDKNLFINYGTYALEQGDLKTARMLVEEGKAYEKESPGIHDNHGWLCLLEGAWDEANELYTTLITRGPAFPEPFLHAAQVQIHYGKVGQAIELLEKALQARYSNTTTMRKETISALKERLEDPKTRRAGALEIDQNTALVASGKLPPELAGTFEEEPELVLSGFAKEKEKAKPKNKQQAKKLDLAEDDYTPNTELTEADLEYARKHEGETN
ncbi:MAG: pilus assembly protein PilF [Spirochaetia bacterium]|nr:pilus assembly protein PilF [Spirochaetia bacterium]